MKSLRESREFVVFPSRNVKMLLHLIRNKRVPAEAADDCFELDGLRTVRTFLRESGGIEIGQYFMVRYKQSDVSVWFKPFNEHSRNQSEHAEEEADEEPRCLIAVLPLYCNGRQEPKCQAIKNQE